VGKMQQNVGWHRLPARLVRGGILILRLRRNASDCGGRRAARDGFATLGAAETREALTPPTPDFVNAPGTGTVLPPEADPFLGNDFPGTAFPRIVFPPADDCWDDGAPPKLSSTEGESMSITERSTLLGGDGSAYACRKKRTQGNALEPSPDPVL
jgi:hypothetical protein